MDKKQADKIRSTIREFEIPENNIEGIFNYCDRWCERCRFTSRCTSYQMEVEAGVNEDNGIQGAVEYVGVVFQEIGKMLDEKMKEFGIDINDLPDEEIPENNHDQPIEILSSEYMMEVLDWFENTQEGRKRKALEYLNILEQKSLEFGEALSVIKWYVSMIPVKISRTVKPTNGDESEMVDEFESQDRIATGKLVLVCIEKSMQAFVLLLEMWKEQEDNILKYLSMLSQIRKGINARVPEAKNYIRPYLDE